MNGWSLQEIHFLLEVRISLTFFFTAAEGDAGCGRFFEGTPEEMNTALNKTLAALPDDTKVYVSSPLDIRWLRC